MPPVAKPKLAWEVAEFYPPQGEWTEADYFALPETNRYAELSEGRLIVAPHPTNRHQALVMALTFRLYSFVRERDLGVVRIAPLPVRLWPGKIREPDICFIAREHLDRLGEQISGVPDLVMEVLSPGTRQTDRTEKFFEYARAGVQEYWMVDPDEPAVEVYLLQEGAYTLLGKHGPGETACSKLLPGFEILVDEVLRE